MTPLASTHTGTTYGDWYNVEEPGTVAPQENIIEGVSTIEEKDKTIVSLQSCITGLQTQLRQSEAKNIQQTVELTFLQNQFTQLMSEMKQLQSSNTLTHDKLNQEITSLRTSIVHLQEIPKEITFWFPRLLNQLFNMVYQYLPGEK